MLCTSGFVDDVMLPIIGLAKTIPVGRILKVTHQGAAQESSLMSSIAVFLVENGTPKLLQYV